MHLAVPAHHNELSSLIQALLALFHFYFRAKSIFFPEPSSGAT